MGKFIDRTGERYGRLTAISYIGNRRWLCRCDCGAETKVQTGNLINGHTVSCGCAKKDTKGKLRNDLTGQKFGRLTVLKHAGYNESGHTALWECTCECGKVVTVRGTNLISGSTTSCGCYKHEFLVEYHTTHGDRDTRIYNIWSKMRGRCNDKTDADYGGRGITVCEEWDKSFEVFRDCAIANGYADHLTIDRIDNNGNYCPENCRWTDARQQARNRRSNNVITFNGETHLAIEWDEILGFSRGTVSRRIKSRGWTVERALTEPIHTKHRGRWSKRAARNIQIS